MFNSIDIINILKKKAEILLNVPGVSIIFNGSRLKDSFCMLDDVTICDILSATSIQVKTSQNRVVSVSLNSVVEIRRPTSINSELSTPRYFEDPDPYGKDYNFQNNIKIINRALKFNKDIEMEYENESYVVTPLNVLIGRRNYYMEAQDHKNIQKNRIFNVKNMVDAVIVKKEKKYEKSVEEICQNEKTLKECIRTKTEVEIILTDDKVIYALPLCIKKDMAGDSYLTYFSYNSEYPSQISSVFIKNVIRMRDTLTREIQPLVPDENNYQTPSSQTETEEFIFEAGQRLLVQLKDKNSHLNKREEIIDVHVVKPTTIGTFIDGRHKNIKKSEIMNPKIIEHNIFKKRRS